MKRWTCGLISMLLCVALLAGCGSKTDGTASDAFVIGDKQQARVVFNNTAIGEMRITKTVVSGEKERDFE